VEHRPSYLPTYLPTYLSIYLSIYKSSEAKYDAGTGWPSFSEAHGTWEKDESHANIVRRPDNSLGSTGTEVICKHVSAGQNCHPVGLFYWQ